MGRRQRRRRYKPLLPKSFAGKWLWRGIWIPFLSENSSQKACNYFREVRKLFSASHRLYMQDHSRGRGLTTTGQPTVSLLPLKILGTAELAAIYIKFRGSKSSCKLTTADSQLVRSKRTDLRITLQRAQFASWESPSTSVGFLPVPSRQQ